jgi:hypothetical protein
VWEVRRWDGTEWNRRDLREKSTLLGTYTSKRQAESYALTPYDPRKFVVRKTVPGYRWREVYNHPGGKVRCSLARIYDHTMGRTCDCQGPEQHAWMPAFGEGVR